MSVNVFPFTFAQPYFLDSAGNINANGTISTFTAGGTTTPTATYSDWTGTGQNGDVITLNAAGQLPPGVFGLYGVLGTTYYIVVADSNGQTIFVQDQVGQEFAAGSGVVLTTTNQSIAGTKAFAGPTGFGNATTTEYATGQVPVIVGGQADTSTGVQLVASTSAALRVGSTETGSASTLGTLTYNISTNTWSINCNNTTELTISPTGANFTSTNVTVNGSAVLTSGSTLAIAHGGTGQTTQTAAFDALAPTTTKGDTIVFNGTHNVRFPVGTDGYVLTADSTQATGLNWTAAGISSQSLVGNGYVVFNGGYTKQWGSFTYNPSSTTTVTFPLAFPTACFSVVTSQPQSTMYGYPVNVANVTRTTFQFVSDGGAAVTIYWEASGH